MAKRDLAKTAIEGGRSKASRYDEKMNTRAERRQANNELRKAIIDPEYETVIEPRQTDWGKSFADKLNPVYRWLEKQVGRPWNKVYGEIRQVFDFRTTAGRHIVDHIYGYVNAKGKEKGGYWRINYSPPYEAGMKNILAWYESRVEVGREWYEYERYDFYIDKIGILRKTKDR